MFVLFGLGLMFLVGLLSGGACVLELFSMMVWLVVVLSCLGQCLLWLWGVCWVAIVIVLGWFGDCFVGGVCVVGVLFWLMMVVVV